MGGGGDDPSMADTTTATAGVSHDSTAGRALKITAEDDETSAVESTTRSDVVESPTPDDGVSAAAGGSTGAPPAASTSTSEREGASSEENAAVSTQPDVDDDERRAAIGSTVPAGDSGASTSRESTPESDDSAALALIEYIQRWFVQYIALPLCAVRGANRGRLPCRVASLATPQQRAPTPPVARASQEAKAEPPPEPEPQGGRSSDGAALMRMIRREALDADLDGAPGGAGRNGSPCTLVDDDGEMIDAVRYRFYDDANACCGLDLISTDEGLQVPRARSRIVASSAAGRVVGTRARVCPARRALARARMRRRGHDDGASHILPHPWGRARRAGGGGRGAGGAVVVF